MKVDGITTSASDYQERTPTIQAETRNVTPASTNHDQIALTEQEKNLLPFSERSIIDAIEKANKVTLDHNTRAEFSVHEVTKDIIIKIIDTESNEVLREFPPKKFLDLIAKLWDLAGVVVDERR